MTRPPRHARALVDRLVAPHLRDAITGDLDELFAAEVAQSPRRARWRYWRRAAAACWHLRARARHAESRIHGDSAMRTAFSDLAHGLRLFVTQPAFTVAAVVTLALAIGANSLIFSMANALLLKPLPLRDPDRLAWILMNGPNTAEDRGPASLLEYEEYRALPAFAGLAGWWRQPVVLRDTGDAERVIGRRVIGDLQGVWGLSAVRGRTLNASDERPGAPRVTVLSHRAWVTRFGGREDVLGRQVLVDGRPHTIVGVLVPDIELGNLAEIDLWLPEAIDPAVSVRTARRWRLTGRLGDGASLADAEAQVAAVSARLATDHPDTNRDWTARVGTTREAVGGPDTWLVLGLLLTVVGLLLALACANVMNLLIARLIGRRQELAVRSALGATRGRIIGQILGEGLVIGLAGAAAGLALAAAGLQGVHALSTEPYFRQLGIDWRVVSFAVGLGLIAPLLFSIAPALRVLGDDVRASLSDGGTRSVGGARQARGHGALVVVQMALAITLVVVAGLVAQSVRHIVRADVGYDASTLLSTWIEVPEWSVPDDATAMRRREALLDRTRRLAGVEAAATTTALPALQFPETVVFSVAGRTVTTERDRPTAGLTVVSHGFFATLGIPLVTGRPFREADSAPHAPAVAVVSREAARRYFGGNALGAVIEVPSGNAGSTVAATVVGVAGDTANPDLDQQLEPQVYLLDQHWPVRRAYLVVRGQNPRALAQPLRAAIREVDPDLATFQLRTVTDAFAEELSSSVLLGALFLAFAIVAVVLAAAGLYGVMSHAVSQRTPEIAVRLALGASTGAIARDIVGRTFRLTLAGAVFGLAGAWALAQTMGSLLYGITANDPATYAGAVALAAVSAALASWTPVRRATSVDPLHSLRQA